MPRSFARVSKRLAAAATAGFTLIAIAAVAQLGAGSAGAASGTAPTTKIITIMFENHSRSETRSTGAMPYMDSLADKYGEATNFLAAVHPSLGNYFVAQSDASADTCGQWDPLPSRCPQSGTTIFDQAIAAGKTAKYYAAAMPSNCSQSDADGYVAHHVPWTYFTSAASHANCERYAVPSGSSTSGNFARDLADGALPNVSWLIPSNFDNAHSAPLGDADAWLKEWMSKILAGPDFTAGRLAIALTWDEPAPDAPRSTPIQFVLVSPHATGGDTATPFTLPSLLRYQADVVGVDYLGPAAMAPDLRSWIPITAKSAPSSAPPSSAPPSSAPPSTTPPSTTPPSSTAPSSRPPASPPPTSASPSETPTATPSDAGEDCDAPAYASPGKVTAVAHGKSVELTGVVSAHAAPVQANFEWGTTARLGKGSAKMYLPPTCAAATLSVAVSNLDPGDTYYYRLITESDAADIYPAVERFVAPTT